MKKNNLLFPVIISLAVLVALFAPFLKVNDVTSSLAQIVFGGFGKRLLCIVLVVGLDLIAIAVLTYFNKLTNVKFLVALGGLIYYSFIFVIIENLAPAVTVAPEAGYIYMFALLIGATLFYIADFFDKNALVTRDIVEIALFVSIAIVLDLPFLKVKVVPNGGSVSLVMLPLILISIRKGPIQGFIASGLVYGLINCLTDGYGIATYPFDYLIGFGSCALAGLFRKQIISEGPAWKPYVFFIVAAVCASAGRLVGAVLSGMILYETPFVGSLTYNLTYLAPTLVGVLVVGLIILPIFLQLMKKYNAK